MPKIPHVKALRTVKESSHGRIDLAVFLRAPEPLVSECALCISATSLLVLWRSRHTCLQGTLNVFLRSARGLLDYRNQVAPRFCAGFALHTCSWVSAQRGGHQAYMRMDNWKTGISVQPTMQHTASLSLCISSDAYRASSTARRVFLPCEYEN